ARKADYRADHKMAELKVVAKVSTADVGRRRAAVPTFEKENVGGRCRGDWRRDNHPASRRDRHCANDVVELGCQRNFAGVVADIEIGKYPARIEREVGAIP